MDKQENNIILTKRDDGSKRATSSCLWTERIEAGLMEKRKEKKMTTPTTNEFEKHPCEEGLNGVVQN